MGGWSVQTARLLLLPVAAGDLAEITAIKADPRVFAVMLGGVRTPVQSAAELAADISYWGANGYGIWMVRDRTDRRFLGLVGLMERPDGRGVALRFALWPEAQGRGLAREAASAALRYGHEQAGLSRIVAVAREDNFASRMVLGSIGMVAVERFLRHGHVMLTYESVTQPG
ncbi:MAG: GNAT family N-acetyltransferase [Rhodospirillales bacterium]|nr:GNAT family N-acetyltransferase [Rhodospirillales bacterium]